jgi:hypothetical protein
VGTGASDGTARNGQTGSAHGAYQWEIRRLNRLIDNLSLVLLSVHIHVLSVAGLLFTSRSARWAEEERSTMNFPGFTAEASIYRASDRYSAAARSTGSTRNAVVPCPHRPPPGPICEDCIWDTYDFPSGNVCAQLCMDRGDPTVYPVPCDPSKCPVKCTRCLSYLTGRFQYCMGGSFGSGARVSCGVQRGG